MIENIDLPLLVPTQILPQSEGVEIVKGYAAIQRLKIFEFVKLCAKT